MSDVGSADLVSYMIVVAPKLESLPGLSISVASLASHATIQILDAVVVERRGDGSIEAHEISEGDQFDELRRVMRDELCLLSDHDIALASLALPVSSAGLIIVVEDQWAEPLSTAARNAGGHIVAGERIPERRVNRVVRQLSGKELE